MASASSSHPLWAKLLCTASVSRRLLTENLGRASEIDVMSWHWTALQGQLRKLVKQCLLETNCCRFSKVRLYDEHSIALPS